MRQALERKMARERVPHVVLTIGSKRIATNTDRAGTLLADAMRGAIQFALTSDSGRAAVSITIERKAKKPYRPAD
jgi:hypothetical protein